LRSAAEDTAGAAVFVAVAHFAVAAGPVEDTAAATSAARDLLVEAPTEAARLWAAGTVDLVEPADSDAASTLQVADTEVATEIRLAMRSRTATGILSGALEAPRMQEVRQDFAMPQLPMADGTRLGVRARV
jgi:hypothetical protein